MQKPSRRQVVGGLAFSLLAAPFRSLFTGSTAPKAVAPQDIASNDPRAEALRAIRFLNSAQVAKLHHVGDGFGTLADLNSPQMRAIYEQRYESSVLEATRLVGDEIVPGFTAKLELSADRRSYTIVVAERVATNGTHFAYATDESGVIRVGSVPAESMKTPHAHFVGQPMRKPVVPQSAAAKAARSIVGFFVPTLQASEKRCGPSDCGVCFTGSASLCGSSCGHCCNLGYADCPWCCETWASCPC